MRFAVAPSAHRRKDSATAGAHPPAVQPTRNLATMIALEDRERPCEAEYLFSPLVSTVVVVGAALAFGLLWLTDEGRRTVLLTPLDPRLRATLIAAGVFVGVWVAAVVREFWQLGLRLDGPVPEGVVVVGKLAVLVAVGGWCGYLAAEQATDWRAFHGLRAQAERESFTVVGLSRYRRTTWLDLAGAADAEPVSVRCGIQDCGRLDVGDRLLVTVETGRGGVRRARFPAAEIVHAARG